MDRFPILRLIIRYGRAGAMIMSLALAVLITVLCWASLGWLAVLAFPPVLAVSYVLLKSYVEIVQIVSEMAH